jgi:hypothetical protein
MKIEFEGKDGKQYTIEYTRNTLSKIDQFKDVIRGEEADVLAIQFHVGLLKHQPNIDIETSSKLRDEVMDMELAAEIEKMISKAVPEMRTKPKNARWKVVK